MHAMYSYQTALTDVNEEDGGHARREIDPFTYKYIYE